jgi:hypothetical protein
MSMNIIIILDPKQTAGSINNGIFMPRMLWGLNISENVFVCSCLKQNIRYIFIHVLYIN